MATQDHPKHHLFGVKHPTWPHQYYALWPILMALWHSQGALNGPFCPRQRPTWRKASENSKLYFTAKTKDTDYRQALQVFEESPFW